MERVGLINVGQIRAARAVLGWTQAELADRSGVSIRTLINIEKGDVQPFASSLRLIRKAMETEGVSFVGQDGKTGILFPNIS